MGVTPRVPIAVAVEELKRAIQLAGILRTERVVLDAATARALSELLQAAIKTERALA